MNELFVCALNLWLSFDIFSIPTNLFTKRIGFTLNLLVNTKKYNFSFVQTHKKNNRIYYMHILIIICNSVIIDGRNEIVRNINFDSTIYVVMSVLM